VAEVVVEVKGRAGEAKYLKGASHTAELIMRAVGNR
jgi:hypothetical protein